MLQSALPVATVGTLMKSNRILKEIKSDIVKLRVDAHRNEKLAVLVWSDAAWAGKTCPQPLVSSQELRQHESCKADDTVRLRFIIVLENRTRKARSSLSADVQALADAEQELYFTRLQMTEFLGFLVNLGNVDETVQRVDGVLGIDAKAIYDSMCGASGPLAMEEKTDSH